jgi:TnpA family transposase
MINSEIPEEKMEELKNKSASLNIPRGTERLYFASKSYQKIQKYLPQLIETFKISSIMKNDPLIVASEYYLKRKKEGLTGIGQDAPTDFIIQKNWGKVIFDQSGSLKTKPWIVCLADSLRTSLRRGSINVDGTKQYKALDSDLVSWEEYKKIEINEDHNLPFTSTAQTVTNSIGKAIYDLSDKEDEWLKNDTASIDYEGKIHFRKLDKLDVPENVAQLRSSIYNNFRERPFSDVLVEADKLTGYTSQLTRLSSGMPIKSTETKLGSALYSVLYAAACNIPLSKMSASTGIPLDFLLNLRDEVIRPQTIQAASAMLVDFYSRLPLAQIWGAGTSSSSDGQGVIVAGDPLGSRFNRKLFKKGTRGSIIYTHILDNYAPFHTQLFPALPREAPYVADGLLYSGISLIPREHYTDTHGYTDIVFALLYLLGFRFCPRIANVPDISLWYLRNFEPNRKDIFDNGISYASIGDQWEAIQRLVYTIYSGQTKASQIIRKLSSFSANHPLHKAFRNLGRLCKTRHILEMAGDMDFRRNMLQGLNKGESRHAFSNEVRLGSRGVFKEKDPELRLSMASATNLAILCACICNTIEMQQQIRSLNAEGMKISEDELRFLSPFPHHHYNFLGRYNFMPIPQINKKDVETQFRPLF